MSELTQNPDGIRDGLLAVARSMDNLTEKLAVTRRTMRVVYVGIAAGFTILIALAALNYRAIQEGHATGAQIKATAAEIKDCTNPSGKCYQQSQASLAKAVAQVEASVTHSVLQTLCDANRQNCADGITPTTTTPSGN